MADVDLDQRRAAASRQHGEVQIGHQALVRKRRQQLLQQRGVVAAQRAVGIAGAHGEGQPDVEPQQPGHAHPEPRVLAEAPDTADRVGFVAQQYQHAP